MQDPVYKTVDVAARIFCAQATRRTTWRDRVRANLAAYFRVNELDGTPNPLVDFGFNIKGRRGQPGGRDRLVGPSSTSSATRRACGRWATRVST